MKEQEFQEKLAVERREIDRIDRELLPLFLERMGCVERVGELKRQAGKPVRNAAREQEIIDRVSRQAGEMGQSAAEFYRAIMAISRDREHNLMGGDPDLLELEQRANRELQSPGKVVCQGVRGAYSHQAAERLERRSGSCRSFTRCSVRFQRARWGWCRWRIPPRAR